ncbi:unnamed protein product [Nezara viridula]|uniref:Uncharacterized protein n=1 Tax=Nezara viridula TaxID=85310 RepID=A0A9P0HPT4_NEZVI|nr:unnamed protein product [Nezara viridula]
MRRWAVSGRLEAGQWVGYAPRLSSHLCPGRVLTSRAGAHARTRVTYLPADVSLYIWIQLGVSSKQVFHTTKYIQLRC